MKEFEKWFEQAGIRFTRGGCCKETWKAALEWALKQRNGPLGGEFVPACIINKELSAKS